MICIATDKKKGNFHLFYTFSDYVNITSEYPSLTISKVDLPLIDTVWKEQGNWNLFHLFNVSLQFVFILFERERNHFFHFVGLLFNFPNASNSQPADRSPELLLGFPRGCQGHRGLSFLGCALARSWMGSEVVRIWIRHPNVCHTVTNCYNTCPSHFSFLMAVNNKNYLIWQFYICPERNNPLYTFNQIWS